MAKVRVYVEVTPKKPHPEAMATFSALSADPIDAAREAERVVGSLSGFGLEVISDSPPVPMYSDEVVHGPAGGDMGFASFATPESSPDVPAESLVVLCAVDADKLSDLEKKDGVAVFGFLPPEPFADCGCAGGGVVGDVAGAEPDGIHPFDLAPSAGGIDCAPFLPGVSVAVIRQLLAVSRPWNDGFTGQNVVVGIVDEGVNSRYPVVGGFARTNTFRPGGAPITSHGSMCAADVLVAAPAVRLLDYPIFDRAGNGLDPLPTWQAILDQRRRNGTPHLTNNSYGYYTIPAKALRTPATDPTHPVNRMIKAAVAAGIGCFFAAGNCGSPCPSRQCNNFTTTPVPINGSNSLGEVITVAAVNSRRSRIGYSSQGPGMAGFATQKPDVSGYSHFFGNFGPGRPGGTAQPFDNGTSAATPVVTGVGALLLSAFPHLTPKQLGDVLRDTAINLGQPGHDNDTGFGVVNAGAAYIELRTDGPGPASAEDEPEAEHAPAPRSHRKKRSK